MKLYQLQSEKNYYAFGYSSNCSGHSTKGSCYQAQAEEHLQKGKEKCPETNSSSKEDVTSEHSQKKKGKSKRQHVEISEDDIENVEGDIEPVEVEVVVLPEDDEQEVSINRNI